MGAPLHGKSGLIYVSGTELSALNAWTLNITSDKGEYFQMGDTWKGRNVGPLDWSGSINAYLHIDSKLLTDAAVAGTAVAILIYPTRNVLTAYYSGNVIFDSDASGDTGSNMSRNGAFVGAGTLSINGFS